MDKNVINANELEFVIFCIENVADKLNIKANIVYDLLNNKSDILQCYIIPSFNVLHTQSKDYIVDDIVGVMKNKGLIK